MTTEKKSFEPLNEGDYLVSMNRIEEKTTRNGGTMLSVSFKVEEGESKNRLIFDSFMVSGSSKKALEISKERISKYLKAIGINGGLEGIGNDYSKLSNFTGTPFIAHVKVKEGDTYRNREGLQVTGKPYNKISTFKAR